MVATSPARSHNAYIRLSLSCLQVRTDQERSRTKGSKMDAPSLAATSCAGGGEACSSSVPGGVVTRMAPDAKQIKLSRRRRLAWCRTHGRQAHRARPTSSSSYDRKEPMPVAATVTVRQRTHAACASTNSALQSSTRWTDRCAQAPRQLGPAQGKGVRRRPT